jgi:uncharacterized protein
MAYVRLRACFDKNGTKSYHCGLIFDRVNPGGQRQRMFEPTEIDPLRFCKLAQHWEIDAELSGFPRLADEFTQGELRCRVVGRIDRHAGCVLHVEIRGELDLICQRCLGQMSHDVAIERDVYLAKDEAELERRDADSETSGDVILLAPKMSLVELVEDEVLLGLPLTPMHAPGVCVIPAEFS